MMDIQRDILLKSFLVESEEGLAQMEQSILEMESHPGDIELVQSIFRVVHTMKGNAGILDLPQLLAFAHGVEDLLDAIRKNTLVVTSDITTLLLAAFDILREMTAAAAEGKERTSQRAKDVLGKISRQIEAVDRARKLNGPEESTKESAAADKANEREKKEPVSTKGVATAPPVVQEEAARTLRVDMEKLDRLLNLAGEITIARGRMTQMLDDKEKASIEEIREAHSLMDALHVELQETILKTRMVSLGPLFRRFNRTVRDVAKAHGKTVQLHIEGEDVEVDTSVVEHLKDPLLHMIRNAVDHGIELPEVRTQAGKPSAGTIAIRAKHEGGNILIEVSDDGAGLNRRKIIELARKKGLVAEVEKLSEHEIYQLIFQSGFSTAEGVSDLSGRGVGMDVVRRNVQSLRGSVHISSRSGAGSTVQIRLPLTLAIIEGFGVGVGDETYVIPLDQVIECVELPEEEDNSERKEGILQLRNEPLPFLYLKDHFQLKGGRSGRQNIVVVQRDSIRAGLAVDVLYGATQTVIKPLPSILKQVPGVSGSAILGTGRVALILDVPALLRDFRMQQGQLPETGTGHVR